MEYFGVFFVWMMISFLSLLSIDYMIKLILSLLIGCILGIEREYRAKPAGIKTYAMICMGACIFTSLSLQMSAPADPSRIASQIVSGLGFIGAGAIFQSKRMITGLTTASMLWVVGALGTLVGFGQYIEALFTLVIIYVCFFGIRKMQAVVFRTGQYTVEIWVESRGVIDAIYRWLDAEKIMILKQSWEKKSSGYRIEVSYRIQKKRHMSLLALVQKMEGVLAVRT